MIIESNVSFMVDESLGFRLSIPQISQTVAQSKNEVAIELLLNDQQAQVESLSEMRIFVPDSLLDNSAEDEDEEEKATSAQSFVNELQSYGGLSEKVSKSIAAFDNLFLLVPRARYDVDLYATFLKLHNNTFTYKLSYKNISRMFLFDNSDNQQHLFVIGLDTPVRQGRTAYSYIVFRFDSNEMLEQTFDLDEKTCEEKYQGLIKPVMKGPIYDVVTRVFKAITGKKVLVPGVGFTSKNGSAAVRCAFKANDGHLFLLEKSFFFLHKPPIYIRHQTINTIEFDRVGSGSASMNKTFDLKITSEGQEYVFTGMNRDEYDRLFAFLKTKNLNLLTSGEENRGDRAAGKGINYDEDSYMRRMDEEGQDTRGGEDFNSSEDEDYAASGSESGSSSSDSSMAEEVSDSDRQSNEKPKKTKEKSSSSHANREEKRSKRKKRGGPKAATTAFFFFSADKREEVKAANPDAGLGDIAKLLGQRWRELTEDEKLPYLDKQKADQERYHKQKASGEFDEASEEEGAAKKGKKRNKPADEPKKPNTAYFLFMNANRNKVATQKPGLKNTEITKLLAEQWKEMKEDDKQVSEQHTQEQASAPLNAAD
jgi:structure-specific recognition protein 1